MSVETSWHRRMLFDVLSTFRYCSTSGIVISRRARVNRRPAHRIHHVRFVELDVCPRLFVNKTDITQHSASPKCPHDCCTRAEIYSVLSHKRARSCKFGNTAYPQWRASKISNFKTFTNLSIYLFRVHIKQINVEQNHNFINSLKYFIGHF